MPFIIILLIILSVAIGVLTLGSTIVRLILLIKYHKLNKKESNTNLTACDLARKVLDANGLGEVQVEKAGFFRMLFFGNHYSVRKKTIFLRKNIINKNSATALGISLQKVGHAIQHKNKAKGFRARYVLSIMSNFSPLIFYGLIIIGLVIDFLTGFKGFGNAPITVIFLIVGIVYYMLVFFALLLTIKIEKRANVMAMEMVRKANLLSEEDTNDLENLLHLYIVADIIDFVITILKIVQLILKLLLQILRNKEQN